MISKIKFRNDVNNFWTELNDYVSDYTSFTGTGQDPSMVQAKLMDMSDEFGDIAKRPYGPTAGNDITNYISGLISGLFEAVALIENNVDTANLTTRVATNVIGGLTQKLQTMNTDWDPAVTTPIFVNIWTAWLDQARAQLAGDITAFAAAEQAAMANSTGFAEAFVNGVFSQYSPIFF
ncbi:hypothetical protein EB118_13405 [bacterium]|nr:hypothetical protein [Actinomycetota bacterium]NDG31049.1 hypothetical protein [bacterium]